MFQFRKSSIIVHGLTALQNSRISGDEISDGTFIFPN